jgi:hypothetical protein
MDEDQVWVFDPSNYYGESTLRRRDGAYEWCVPDYGTDYGTDNWYKIPDYLAQALIRHHEETNQ